VEEVNPYKKLEIKHQMGMVPQDPLVTEIGGKTEKGDVKAVKMDKICFHGIKRQEGGLRPKRCSPWGQGYVGEVMCHTTRQGGGGKKKKETCDPMCGQKDCLH